MYVHGFLSSGQSGTVKMLQELMPNATLVAEDIPVHAEEAIEMLRDMQQREKPDLIVGTSMGGMFTEMLHGTDRILVNPAFEMGNTMSSMTGRQEFQNPRKDGVQELMVNKGLIKDVHLKTNYVTKYTIGDLFGVSNSADFTFSNAEFMDSGTGKNF